MGEQAARNGLCITPRQCVSLLFLELQSSHLFDFLETHFELMKSIFFKMDDYVTNLCETGVQKSWHHSMYL